VRHPPPTPRLSRLPRREERLSNNTGVHAAILAPGAVQLHE
jgi:hypothetical protein